MTHREAEWKVNGQTLSIAQAMTMRVALEYFAERLHSEGLGEDDTGRGICACYQAAIAEIRRKLYGAGA